MTVYSVGVLDGDGIGPEITSAAVDVLRAATSALGIMVDLVPLPMGIDAITSHGHPMPSETLDGLSDCHGWLMGPHDVDSYPAGTLEAAGLPPAGLVRRHFELYANIRPSRTFITVSGQKPVDAVIVRENSEGFYSDRNMFLGAGEFMPHRDVAISVGVFTRVAIERIAHVAFSLARDRRQRLAVVHKASVLKMTTGLFLDICKEIGTEYPDVEIDEYHIDALAAHLVRRPNDFGVIVAENMFGDILSDLLGEVVGGLGLAPSLNAGERWAMGQPAHGSAPDIAGRGIANPVSAIMSAAMLLRWLSQKYDDEALRDAADLIETAVDAAIRSGVRTMDLGGTAGTRDFCEAVIGRVA